MAEAILEQLELCGWRLTHKAKSEVTPHDDRHEGEQSGCQFALAH